MFGIRLACRFVSSDNELNYIYVRNDWHDKQGLNHRGEDEDVPIQDSQQVEG